MLDYKYLKHRLADTELKIGKFYMYTNNIDYPIVDGRYSITLDYIDSHLNGDEYKMWEFKILCPICGEKECFACNIEGYAKLEVFNQLLECDPENVAIKLQIAIPDPR